MRLCACAWILAVIIVVCVYAFVLHKGKITGSNVSHKENFSEGLTYEEYVEKYGEPKDWTPPWKRD